MGFDTFVSGQFGTMDMDLSFPAKGRYTVL